MRRIAIGAGGISVLIIGVALAWSGVRPRIGFGPPPEISAPATPLRVAPTDPGGLTVPEANVPIMSGETSTAAPQISAPAAPPDIAQLQAASGETPPAAAPAPHAVLNGPVEAVLATTQDQASAGAIWAKLAKELPDTFNGKIQQVTPAVVNGQSVFRLSVAFPDMSSAQVFCAAVTAKGADCTVAAF
jgi:hypothetical protein